MNRLKYLREINGYKQSDIAKRLGITSQAYCNYELNRRELRAETLVLLSNIYDVSVDYILGLTDEVKRYPVSDAAPAMEKAAKRKLLEIPILSDVRAGFGSLTDAFMDENIETAPAYGLTRPQEYCYFHVRGASMSPYILEDDLALVHMQNTAEDGQIVVAIVGGEEGTIKKLRIHESFVELVSFNPSYEPLIVDTDDLMIWGRVVQTMRRLGDSAPSGSFTWS